MINVFLLENNKLLYRNILVDKSNFILVKLFLLSEKKVVNKKLIKYKKMNVIKSIRRIKVKNSKHSKRIKQLILSRSSLISALDYFRKI